MKLKTRVFELANEKHISLPRLARAMGISVSEVYRVRKGQRKKINEVFIVGALKAFPGYKFEDLFYIESGKGG